MASRRDHDHKRLHDDDEALVIAVVPRSDAALARPAAVLCVLCGLCVDLDLRPSWPSV